MGFIGVGDFKATTEMVRAVTDVVQAGNLSYGEQSKKFEKDMARLHGNKHGVLSNSGTSSLQVALQAMKEIHGWQDGDEVICPASTFVATVNVVLHNRMKPILVDIEDGYWSMNAGLIESAITPKTRAIIPVHPFGQPANMYPISFLAQKHNLLIIQDSCECLGVTYANQPLGHWGHITVFSMYVAHIITCGIGGLAITDNEDYATKMRSLVNHGRDSIYISPWQHGEDIIERRFKFDSVGHSFRITEMEAAIANEMLKDLGNNLRQRYINANHFYRLIEDYNLRGRIQLMSRQLGSDHSWMMMPIVCEDKAELVPYLESHGIETRDALPLTNQPVYKDLFNPDDYPVAKKLNNFGFYVGCHQYLTSHDMYIIADRIRRFYE